MNKNKGMVVTTVKYKIHQPLVSCDVEAIDAVHNFEYLGVYLPNQHSWSRCLTRIIETGTEQRYEFENMCHLNKPKDGRRENSFLCTSSSKSALERVNDLKNGMLRKRRGQENIIHLATLETFIRNEGQPNIALSFTFTQY